MYKAAFGCMRQIRGLILLIGLPPLALVRSYLQSGVGARNGSDTEATEESLEHQYLWEAHVCNQNISPIDKADFCSP